MDRVINSQDIVSHIRKSKIVQGGEVAGTPADGDQPGDDGDDRSSGDDTDDLHPSLAASLERLNCDTLQRDPDKTSWESRFSDIASAVVQTSLPESCVMLEADVVGPLLLSDNVMVGWQKILGGESEKGTQMFMPDDLLGKPGRLYSKDNVCKASGINPKALQHSFPLMGTDPDRQRNIFVTRPYKNHPEEVWRAILQACEARKERYEASKSKKGKLGKVTCYGSGGSSLPMGSSVPQIGRLARNPHDKVVVLELSDGQSLGKTVEKDDGSTVWTPAKNYHYAQNFFEQQILGMFVDLSSFCTPGQLRYLCDTYPFLLYDVFKSREFKGDLTKLLGGSLLFVDYVRMDAVSIERCRAQCDEWGDLDHTDDAGTNPPPDTQEPRGESLPAGLGTVPRSSEEMIAVYGANSSYLDMPHLRFVFGRAFTDIQMRLMIQREGLCRAPAENPRYTVVRVDLDDPSACVMSLPPDVAVTVGKGDVTVRRAAIHRHLRSSGYKKYIVAEPTMHPGARVNLLLPRYKWGRETVLATSAAATADSSWLSNDAEITTHATNQARSTATELEIAEVAVDSNDADHESSLFGRGCYAEMLLLLSAVTHAAAGRFLGRGLFRRGGVLYAGPLPADHSSKMFAANPGSVPNRSFDVVPLAGLAIANRCGLTELRSLDLTGTLGSELTKPGPLIARSRMDGQTMVTPKVGAFFGNIFLARFTGRVSFLRMIYEVTCARGKAVEMDDSNMTHSLGFADAEEDDVDKNYLGPALDLALASVPGVFSRQHFGSIPKSFSRLSNAELANAVRRIHDSGGLFVERLKAHPDLWKKSDCTSPESILAHFRGCQRSFFELVRQLIADTVGKAPHPKGKFTDNENFLANQVVLDLQLAISPVFLEPYRIEGLPPEESDVTDGLVRCVPTLGFCGDPNFTAYSADDTPFGFGSKAGMDFLKVRREKLAQKFGNTVEDNSGKGKRGRRSGPSFEHLYREFISHLREVPESVLHSIGLSSVVYQHSYVGEDGSACDQTFRVVYDILSGNIFCARMFEHCLCKLEVYIKQKTAGYCFTQDHSFARPWTHPVVLGDTKLNLRRFSWESHVPNIDVVFFFIEQSYYKAHCGKAVIPAFCSMGPDDRESYTLGEHPVFAIEESLEFVRRLDIVSELARADCGSGGGSSDANEGFNTEGTEQKAVSAKLPGTRGEFGCRRELFDPLDIDKGGDLFDPSESETDGYDSRVEGSEGEESGIECHPVDSKIGRKRKGVQESAELGSDEDSVATMPAARRRYPKRKREDPIQAADDESSFGSDELYH